MTQALPVRIWREGGRFLARCLPLGVVSEGTSREGALEHLRQGLALYLDGPLPKLVTVGAWVDGPWCPSSVSSRQAVEKLKSAGFYPLAEADGHLKMSRETGEGPLVVLIPLLKEDEELAIGSLQAILEQACLTRAQFNALPQLEEAGGVHQARWDILRQSCRYAGLLMPVGLRQEEKAPTGRGSSMAATNLLLRGQSQTRRAVYEHFRQAMQHRRDQNLPICGELREGEEGLLAQFFLDVQQDHIRAASYQCTTCVTLVAYCELLAGAVSDIPLREVMLLEPSDLIAAMPGVPPFRHDRAHLAVGALHSAVRKAQEAQPGP